MSAIKLFCDILAHEMELENDQVYIYNQKIDLPKDDRLYIAVGILTCKPFSNTRKEAVSGDDLNEEVSSNFLTTLSVDILSRGVDARDRKEEIILALGGTYAQSVQEANGFLVGRISTSFVNLSSVEGAAIPYRFNISVQVQYFVSKIKAIEYYDDFTDSVITEA